MTEAVPPEPAGPEAGAGDARAQPERNAAGFVVSDRVLTVPNAITFLRIGLTPVFLWTLLVGRYVAAAILFVVVSATDFVDGRLARRFDQVTRIGTMLDPVADRLLILATAIAVVVKGLMPAWLIGLVVLRELSVSIWTLYLKGRGVQLEVTMVGKWAATLVFTSLPLFILQSALDEPARSVLWWIATAVGTAGVSAGFVANYHYVVEGRRALASGTSP